MSLTFTDQELEAARKSGSKVKVDAWNKPAPAPAKEVSGVDQALAAIIRLLEKIPEALKQTAPEVTVNVPPAQVSIASPQITVPAQVAPQVTFHTPEMKHPTSWVVENIARDANNRLKGFRIRAE